MNDLTNRHNLAQYETEYVNLSRLTADRKYQMRVNEDDDHIQNIKESIVEKIANGEKPLDVPIAVALLGEKLYILDGFHRYSALSQVDYQDDIPICVVDKWSHDTAFQYCILANTEHRGLIRNTADKTNTAFLYVEHSYKYALDRANALLNGRMPSDMINADREWAQKLIEWNVSAANVADTCVVSLRTIVVP